MFFYSIALYDGGPKVWKDCGGVDLVGEGYLSFLYFAKRACCRGNNLIVSLVAEWHENDYTREKKIECC